MTRRKLGHLSGANQKRGVSLQRVEYLLAEFHRHVADRNSVGADARFGAHAFGDTEGVVNQAIQNAAGRSSFERD